MEELLHVTEPAIWREAAAQGGIACPAGGFIHLCTPAQLGFVLGRHFTGRKDLLLLRLDPAGLDVRWETSETAMPRFPHLYGDLPASAVRATEAL